MKMFKNCWKKLGASTTLLATVTFGAVAWAQVPGIINYQGEVAANSGGALFNGTGQFKFALVSPGSNTAFRATARANIVGVNRLIDTISVLYPGLGYVTAPAVTILDPQGPGSGASAVAVLAGDHLDHITVQSPGSGYSDATTVTLELPPERLVYDTYWSNDGSSTGGSEPASAVPLAVNNGVFSVNLGETNLANMIPIPTGVFNNGDVRVRLWFNDGVNGFERLPPDVRIVAVGYAMMAAKVAANAVSSSAIADGAITAAKLASNAIATVNVQDGAITAAKLAPDAIPNANNSWRLSGNGGTTAGTHFIGTTDNQPLEFKVNGLRALRLEDNGDSSNGNFDLDTLPDGAPNVIGGSASNFVAAGIIGATIAGGGATNISEFLGPNSVLADFGVVGGGTQNRIAVGSFAATIAGGRYNYIEESSSSATIAGGLFNTIGTNSDESAIGGGWDNGIAPNSHYGTIAGGRRNGIGESSIYATIAGGYQNNIGINSESSAIGGGSYNAIAANSSWATIAGGLGNSAVSFAFAAGRRAKANHVGSLVWADSQNADFASTADNQFNIRAAGGVRLSDDTPSLSFGSTTRQMMNLWGTQYGIGVQAYTMYFRTDDYFAWFRRGSHSDLEEPGPGGTELMWLSQYGLWVNGTFVSLSDRNAKENFDSVNSREVLKKVASLPISEWNFKQDKATRHIGPMAQDFYAAFHVGPDDKHIATVDADGVALAAIQGLHQIVTEQGEELQAKGRTIVAFQKQVTALQERLAEQERVFEQRLAALEKATRIAGNEFSQATPHRLSQGVQKP